MPPIYRLPADPAAPWPPVGRALRDPDGLLAVGGDLSPERLLAAYRHGVFPWFSPGEPILWWSPDPRAVFRTSEFRLARRTRARLRSSDWVVRADTCFDAVIAACAVAPRPGQDGTWIGPEMRAAYRALHDLGHAHSIEVESPDGALVGGLYGVAIGRMFFGESMFSARPDGSRIALAALCARLAHWGWPLLDAQVENPHLMLLGARRMPRPDFVRAIRALCAQPGPTGSWTEAFGTVQAHTLASGPPAPAPDPAAP